MWREIKNGFFQNKKINNALRGIKNKKKNGRKNWRDET